MLFSYGCEECGGFDRDFPIGKAPRGVTCDCGKVAKRTYDGMSFILKGGGWPSKKGSFNKEMTARNERANSRMRKEHGKGPVRTVAHDYGDGDIREV